MTKRRGVGLATGTAAVMVAAVAAVVMLDGIDSISGTDYELSPADTAALLSTADYCRDKHAGVRFGPGFLGCVFDRLLPCGAGEPRPDNRRTTAVDDNGGQDWGDAVKRVDGQCVEPDSDRNGRYLTITVANYTAEPLEFFVLGAAGEHDEEQAERLLDFLAEYSCNHTVAPARSSRPVEFRSWRWDPKARWGCGDPERSSWMVYRGYLTDNPPAMLVAQMGPAAARVQCESMEYCAGFTVSAPAFAEPAGVGTTRVSWVYFKAAARPGEVTYNPGWSAHIRSPFPAVRCPISPTTAAADGDGDTLSRPDSSAPNEAAPASSTYTVEVLSRTPLIAVVRGFASTAECSALADRGGPIQEFHRASTSGGDRRNGYVAEITLSSDLGDGAGAATVQGLKARLLGAVTNLTGFDLDWEGQEPLELAVYAEPGDRKLRGCDGGCDGGLAAPGLRVATATIHCEVAVRGGELGFVRAGVKVIPEDGDLVVMGFRDTNGTMTKGTAEYHRCPVAGGTSITATQRFREGVSRDRPYSHWDKKFNFDAQDNLFTKAAGSEPPRHPDKVAADRTRPASNDPTIQENTGDTPVQGDASAKTRPDFGPSKTTSQGQQQPSGTSTADDWVAEWDSPWRHHPHAETAIDLHQELMAEATDLVRSDPGRARDILRVAVHTNPSNPTGWIAFGNASSHYCAAATAAALEPDGIECLFTLREALAAFEVAELLGAVEPASEAALGVKARIAELYKYECVATDCERYQLERGALELLRAGDSIGAANKLCQTRAALEVEFQEWERMHALIAGETMRRIMVLLRVCGVVGLVDVLDPDAVELIATQQKADFEAFLERLPADRPPGATVDDYWINVRAASRGGRRFELKFPLVYPYTHGGLSANPFVLSAVKALLGTRVELDTFSSVTSLPGGLAMDWHMDVDWLDNRHNQGYTMPHALVFLTALSGDVGQAEGPTQFMTGSHVPFDLASSTQQSAGATGDGPEDWPAPVISFEASRGTAVLFDIRVMHRGTSNKSDKNRAIGYISYVKEWFSDKVNFAVKHTRGFSSHPTHGLRKLFLRLDAVKYLHSLEQLLQLHGLGAELAELQASKVPDPQLLRI